MYILNVKNISNKLIYPINILGNLKTSNVLI